MQSLLHYNNNNYLPSFNYMAYYYNNIPSSASEDVEVEEDDPDFWSSYSVVESLFRDENTTISSFGNFQQMLKQEKESLLLLLPTNLILIIFSNLGGADLARLERVCKKLRPLASENSLWKELYMKRWRVFDFFSSVSASEEGVIQFKKVETSIMMSEKEKKNKQDESAWIYSLLQQNERWKDIYKIRHSAEQWRIGTLKMFNGCWGFISQVPDKDSDNEDAQPLDIFFHRKDISGDGAWYDDWWLQDTPGVSRSQKCGYWDTFLYGRKVRYKQRAAYAQGRRPQACQISFLEQDTGISRNELMNNMEPLSLMNLAASSSSISSSSSSHHQNGNSNVSNNHHNHHNHHNNGNYGNSNGYGGNGNNPHHRGDKMRMNQKRAFSNYSAPVFGFRRR